MSQFSKKNYRRHLRRSCFFQLEDSDCHPFDTISVDSVVSITLFFFKCLLYADFKLQREAGGCFREASKTVLLDNYKFLLIFLSFSLSTSQQANDVYAIVHCAMECKRDFYAVLLLFSRNGAVSR